MRRLLIAFLLATPAGAQVAYPPIVAAGGVDASTVDAKIAAATAPLATATAVTDAATLAQQAKTAADTAYKPMALVPPVETPGGSTGSGTNCRLVNAANNRISRTGVFSYGTDGRVLCSGSTTCSWADALPSGADSYPLLYTPLGRAASCSVASTTNTGFTGMTCTQPVVGISLGGSTVISAGLTAGQVFVLMLPSTQANR